MTWIFEVSVEGAICEPKKINFFFGPDKLLMIEIKSKRAYNHVDAWYAMTQSKWKYFFLDMSFFFGCCCCCWRKYWRLKIQHFFGEEGNDQLDYNHVKNQLMKKALVLISKSLVSFVHFNWSSKFEDASG